MWIIYRNDGQTYRRFIACTTKELAESQLQYNKNLGNDVVLLETNMTASQDIISLLEMEEILNSKKEKINA